MEPRSDCAEATEVVRNRVPLRIMRDVDRQLKIQEDEQAEGEAHRLQISPFGNRPIALLGPLESCVKPSHTVPSLGGGRMARVSDSLNCEPARGGRSCLQWGRLRLFRAKMAYSESGRRPTIFAVANKSIKERRTELRLLCADFVEVEWRHENGRKCRTVANLEDISQSGACIQLDFAVPPETPVRLRRDRGDLDGVVRYCVYREIAYFLGIEFEPGQKWNERIFKPLHLFDPRLLVRQRTKT